MTSSMARNVMAAAALFFGPSAHVQNGAALRLSLSNFRIGSSGTVSSIQEAAVEEHFDLEKFKKNLERLRSELKSIERKGRSAKSWRGNLIADRQNSLMKQIEKDKCDILMVEGAAERRIKMEKDAAVEAAKDEVLSRQLRDRERVTANEKNEERKRKKAQAAAKSSSRRPAKNSSRRPAKISSNPTSAGQGTVKNETSEFSGIRKTASPQPGSGNRNRIREDRNRDPKYSISEKVVEEHRAMNPYTKESYYAGEQPGTAETRRLAARKEASSRRRGSRGVEEGGGAAQGHGGESGRRRGGSRGGAPRCIDFES